MRFSVSVHQRAAWKVLPGVLHTLGCPSEQILRRLLAVVCLTGHPPAPAPLGPRHPSYPQPFLHKSWILGPLCAFRKPSGLSR